MAQRVGKLRGAWSNRLMQFRWRPWALLTPIMVLIVALPMLRPLFWPGEPGPSESLLWASVQSVSTGNALRLPEEWEGKPGTVTIESGRAQDVSTSTVDASNGDAPTVDAPTGDAPTGDASNIYASNTYVTSVYASRPPLFAVMLAGPTWAVVKLMGLDEGGSDAVLIYLVTLIGVTIPTAIGASMLYRTARLFELPRAWRSILALTCVMGSGWISYATVLNPHAPAAACMTASVTIIMFVAAARRVSLALGWLMLSGLFAGLAVAIDPWTICVAGFLPVVVLGLPALWRQRILGVVLLLVGTLPALWAHSAWSITTVGSFFPHSITLGSARAIIEDDGVALSWMSDAAALLLGRHGLLNHFPLIIAGLIGAGMVVRRHWPAHAKLLAGVSVVSLFICLFAGLSRDTLNAGELRGEMFAQRWAVCTVPLVILWCGPLLRHWLGQDRLTMNASSASKRLRRWSISVFCIAWTWSVLASIAGATGALPERPYGGHTALTAAKRALLGK